jgi:CBS-domain-containing membrane protein
MGTEASVQGQAHQVLIGKEGPSMKATDIMTPDVITVKPDARTGEVAEIMLASRISAVPVIGERGELVGIVSEGDLMRRAETHTERRRAWWLEIFAGSTTRANDYVQANAQKVSDIMTREVVTATPDTPLGEIAALLERHHIKRVPIVKDGKLVGIVSRANLLQALASIRKKLSIATAPADSAIRDNVLARLRNEPWVKLWSVNVIVHEGVVELWGIVDTAAEKAAIRVLVEATPGVREVIDHTT